MCRQMVGAFLLYAALTVTSHGAANTDLGNGFINAAGPGYVAPTLPIGTPCDSSTPSSLDATTAIGTAIGDVAGMGGGIVYVPTGTYCLKTHLNVLSNVTLRGSSDSPPDRGAGIPIAGTVLLAIEGKGSTTGNPFIFLSSGATLEGVTIYYPEQTLPTGSTFTPILYPFAIRGVENTSIQNVMLWNPYMGVDLATSSSGRHRIKGLYGQPLLLGVKVDRSLDVGRIDEVHFFPFWSATNTAVENWQRSYATAFVFNRCDLEEVSHVFAINYAVGAWFDVGSPSNLGCAGTFTDVKFDFVAEGLHVQGTSPIGVTFSQLYVNVIPYNFAQNAIRKVGVGGQVANINVSQATFIGQPSQAILWDGAGTITVRNSVFQTFLSGAPAIQLTGSGGTALVQDNQFAGAIAGTPAISIPVAASRSMFTGNSLYGSTVVNASPTFLQANNLP